MRCYLCDQICGKVDAATHIEYSHTIIDRNSTTYMHSHMRGHGPSVHARCVGVGCVERNICTCIEKVREEIERR